jgi:hypothetical protein
MIEVPNLFRPILCLPIFLTRKCPSQRRVHGIVVVRRDELVEAGRGGDTVAAVVFGDVTDI